MSSNNNKNNNNATIVHLNVGGTKYEVSRSLITSYPDTMLARLVSDTWQQGREDPAGAEIFIERNGMRFQFVLDYMRDQKVHLPVGSLSKASVLQELDYFGFESVPPDAIDGSCASYQVIKHLARIRKEHEEQIRYHNEQIKYCTLAYACFNHLSTQLSYKGIHFSSNGDARLPTGTNFQRSPFDQDCFDRCMAKYGFKCESHDYRNGRIYINLAPLKEDDDGEGPLFNCAGMAL